MTTMTPDDGVGQSSYWTNLFVTQDPQAAHDWMRMTYFDHTARVSTDASFAFTSGRSALDSVVVSSFRHTAATTARAETPRETVVVLKPSQGRYVATSGRAELRLSPGQTGLLPTGSDLSAAWRDLRINAVTWDKLELELLAQDVTGRNDLVSDLQLTKPILKDRAARFWQTVSTVIHPMCQTSITAGPLVRQEAKRLLVAALLEAFPVRDSSNSVRYPLAKDAWLRRALRYIDDNADREIRLADIAEAARVSPRTLQAGFRRHLNTSPLDRLRCVRLDAAHRELQARRGDQSVTVATVAHRWGFAHLGRFAAIYRKRFGESPRTTLHG